MRGCRCAMATGEGMVLRVVCGQCCCVLLATYSLAEHSFALLGLALEHLRASKGDMQGAWMFGGIALALAFPSPSD